MSDVLKEALEMWPNAVAEAREVVKTVEVVVNRETYRLDVKRNYGVGTFEGKFWFDVRVWRYKWGTETTETSLVYHEVPWLNEDSAELALYRAISFLATGTI